MVRLARCPILLVAALVVAILPLGAPAPRTALAATPRIQLSPTSGFVGTSVAVLFLGFPKNRTVTISWDGKALASTTSSAAGDGSVSIQVPNARKGGHTITATRGQTSASARFTVVPRLRLSPSTVEVGDTLSVSLRGYAKGEAIDILLDSTAKRLATVAASGTGSASITVTVPAATGGRHKIIGHGATGSQSAASFVVVPSLNLKPGQGQAGSLIRVALRGYLSGETIEIQWRDPGGTRSMGFATASSTGSANATVPVPMNAAPGTYAVIGRGYPVSYAEAPFTVTAA
jgi:hypothetical protein